MAQSSKPNAPEVKKWMKDLNDWFSVGEKLGVRFSKLTGLEDKYPTDAVKAREEMADSWLEKDPNPTWARLADAFDYAGQRAIGRKIRETYNCPKKLPQKRPYFLRHYERPEDTSEAPTGPPTSYPKPPPSPPPSPPLYRMPGKSFECSCKNFVPALKHARDVSGTKGAFLPNFRVAASLRIATEAKLKQESDEMIFRFGSFINRILRSLKSRGVSPSSVMRCLLNFGALPSSDRAQIPLLSHRSDQLKRATTVDEVILIMSDFISFFNHTVLVYLVKEMGSNEDQEELDTFLLYCDVFAKRTIFATPPYMYGYMWLNTEKLVVLSIEERSIPCDSFTVKQLYEYVRTVCKVLRVLPHAMHLCRVDREPTELVCRIPPHVADEIFPLSAEQDKKLGSLGVCQLHCVDHCYRKKDPKRQATESDDVATSDFLSLEEDNSDMMRSKIASQSSGVPVQLRKKPTKKKSSKKTARKKSAKRQTKDLLLSQLRACCNYHEQMNRLRNQSSALVIEGDMGYDGDSETSEEDFAFLDTVPKMPIRHGCKRLKWRLTHTQF